MTDTELPNPEVAIEIALRYLSEPNDIPETFRDDVLVLCHRVIDAHNDALSFADFFDDYAKEQAEMVETIRDLKHTISLFGIEVDDGGGVLYVVSPGGDA